MRLHRALCLAVVAAAFALAACRMSTRKAEGRGDIRKDSDAAVVKAKASDPNVTKFFEAAFACAVFPRIGRSAVGVGGAQGNGVLYREGWMVGYCDVRQASAGLRLGAQTYAQIICFEDQDAFDRFKGGNFTFDAQAPAVALEAGMGVNAKYSNGVAVFTMDEAGRMFAAEIGGQTFGYEAL